ncbi:hypothetical protein [Flavobacterium columnare]|uniref:hypothetical protein n=1 Tax=Flavobacterium columnare TaxID=996 RepID=UPI001CE12005|nr:hypothetical protein [Flavobacterium columnare]
MPKIINYSSKFKIKMILLSKGRKASYVAGTVSLAEFFVTLAASVTFFGSD